MEGYTTSVQYHHFRCQKISRCAQHISELTAILCIAMNIESPCMNIKVCMNLLLSQSGGKNMNVCVCVCVCVCDLN